MARHFGKSAVVFGFEIVASVTNGLCLGRRPEARGKRAAEAGKEREKDSTVESQCYHGVGAQQRHRRHKSPLIPLLR